MKIEDLKTGMTVRVVRKFDADRHPHWVEGMDKTLGETGVVTSVSSETLHIKFADGNDWSYLPCAVDPVRVLKTEKILCGGRKCRKIVSIVGEGGCETKCGPWYKIVDYGRYMGVHSVDDKGIPSWRSPGSGPKGFMFDGFDEYSKINIEVPCLVIREECVYLEDTFQEIVKWLRRASENMAKEEMWSGEEEVVI